MVELKTHGQCVEGIKIELNQVLEEEKMAMNMAIAMQEQMAAVVPYYNYNIYLGGKNI